MSEANISAWKERATRAAESILDNESLTADLDDAAAKVLLDWGIACAELVARETADLSAQEAGEAIDSRLRAIRRLMRQVRQWATNRPDMDAETGAKLLNEIIEQAAAIYPGFAPPDNKRRNAFLREHFGQERSWLARLFGKRRAARSSPQDPGQIVADLRQIIEGQSGSPPRA